ncbi:MAG: NnrU family protein [Terricaulis sp.]
MNYFGAALVLFVLLHVGVAATGLRARLVNAVGEAPYRGLFSLVSFALLAFLAFGFHDMRTNPFDPLNEMMWLPSPELRGPGYVLVAFGFTIGVAGLLTKNPTAAFFESALNDAEPTRGILRVTRHPFLWGVAFWAAGHLLMNGERFAVMLFGALGAMALYGSRSIDRKRAALNPEGWARFAAVTSSVPFAAIVQGRNRLRVGEMWWRLIAGLAVFFAMGFAHQWLIGAPAF